MYAWIWRRLPGSVAVRSAVLAVVLVAAVVTLFVGVVFPWADHVLSVDGSAIGR